MQATNQNALQYTCKHNSEIAQLLEVDVRAVLGRGVRIRVGAAVLTITFVDHVDTA